MKGHLPCSPPSHSVHSSLRSASCSSTVEATKLARRAQANRRRGCNSAMRSLCRHQPARCAKLKHRVYVVFVAGSGVGRRDAAQRPGIDRRRVCIRRAIFRSKNGRLPISMEVELKLSARAADVSALKRALVEMAPGSVSSEERLISTYYDTRDLALKRQGLTLRVREQAGRFIQTVKTDAVTGADMLSRGEWEDVVAENRPDPRATQSGARLPEGVGDDLWPLFVTEVKRTSVAIEPTAETEIEVSIDEGEIRGAASDRVEPISEIELELKRGDAAALYDLALELLEGAPLRFEMRSKAERGYRLVEGAEAAPAEVHAEPVPLDDTMSVESALQKIGRGCLAQLLRNEAAVLSGQAEGVHQMRIAVRRLRSAMSAVKKMLSAEDYRWTSGELARLAGALGPARDLDTFETALLEPARDALAD